MSGTWIRHPKTATSVVFVHGFLSSGEKCWRHEIGAYWPEFINKETALEDIGVYVFTYQTGVFSGDYRLSDIVDSLKANLRLDGLLECDRLIFVCHSMGGIVVRKYLVERAMELVGANIEIGLFLIASPSLGSYYGKWLKPLAKLLGQEQADVLAFENSNAWLNDLDKEFMNLKESRKLIISGKELIEDKFIVFKRVFRKQKVVPAFSGARYFGEAIKIERSDHSSIAKPANRRKIQHRLLCEFIEKMLKPYSVHAHSKYRLQQTPEIVLNELHRKHVSTGDIKLIPGINIHDLKKRVQISNPELAEKRVNEIVGSAREIAFSSKYATPREDEKLVDTGNLGLDGIREWHQYLENFLWALGISETKGLRVLDVGIGNAFASHIYLQKFSDLTGIDISQEALEYAKQKLPNAILKTGSAEDLSDVDSFSIDLYLSLRCYQSSLFDIKDSIHEAFRVLRHGGAIVISVPSMFLKKDKTGNVVGVLNGLIPQGSSVPSMEYAMKVSTKIEEYMRLLGFKGVQLSDASPFEVFIGARK